MAGAGDASAGRVGAQRAAASVTAAARPGPNGARITPSSVTMPVISSAGVTSNDGLRTVVPGGAIATPRMRSTSLAARSSISIESPSAVARSTEDVGAQT